MSKILLKLCLLAFGLSATCATTARAQKTDLDIDVKNVPKEVDSAPAPTPPGGGTQAPVQRTRTLQPAGTYTNRFSGVQFPKRVGEFMRQDVMIFDAEDRNTGADYGKKRGSDLISIITPFSYPVPPQMVGSGAAAMFEKEKLAITTRWRDAKLIREGPYRAPDGSFGDFAEYEFNAGTGKPLLVRSRLYLFENNGWLLKIRATYATSRARDGASETEVFLRGFGTGPLRNQGGN